MSILIKQRGAHDCGIACLAMALQVTYDQALELVGRDPNDEVVAFDGMSYAGIIPEEITLSALRHRRATIVMPVFEISAPGTWQNAWFDVFKIARVEHIAELVFEGRKSCILGVESKNCASCGHWVYVHDGVVYDPSLRETYKTGETLPVQIAILFVEGDVNDDVLIRHKVVEHV